jgi:multisubunit Na+/H+ antiporter MnhG subunit
MGSFDAEQIMKTRVRIGAILIALFVLMTIPVTASESIQLRYIRAC